MKPQMLSRVAMAENRQAWPFLVLGGVFAAYAMQALLWLMTGTAHAAEKPRVVAIDGSISEIVYALGKGDLMVGRDITTTYPKEAAKLPSVGYMRQLSAEGILSLNPTLVLATKDAKPQNVLTRLQDAGVHVEIVENVYTPEGVEAKIKQIAKVLDAQAAGDKLVEQVRQSVNQAKVFAEKAIQQQGKSAKAIFVLNVRGGNMMVAGKHSRADKMMQLAGIENPAAEQFNGYKPLTAEAAIQYNPDYLLTMQHGVGSAGGKEAILNTPAIRMTQAGKNGRLLVMDDSFLTFGPRLGEAIESLVKQVYVAN
ncbi:MAG: hemin ABC transporter substrate-binding protein [Hydrogenovibrio sp.]